MSELLASAEARTGGALTVAGEPGIGKSALLSLARSSAARRSFTVLSAVGIESESELPFAGLGTLLRPLAGELVNLSAVQAAALRSALGMEIVAPVEPLAVYYALLELLAASARTRPVLVLVDDAQWLDGASREAVHFLARRVGGEAIAVLTGVRTGEGVDLDWPTVARLDLAGLDERSAAVLLHRARPTIAPAVSERLWAGTSGNPLALLEILPLLTEDQAAGRAPLEEPLPVGRRLERVFARRIGELPRDTQRVLLLAAASHTGAMAVLGPASKGLDLDPEALAPAEAAGFVEVMGGTLAWRHPLLRSAAYHSASPSERRQMHRALADSGGPERSEDHRAWHRAAASLVPDEKIAAELDLVGERATRRGALSTAVRALRQAAGLTPDDERRARRLIGAAEAAIATGRWDEAEAMLKDADARTSDPILRAQAARVLGRAETLREAPGAVHDRLVAVADSISTSAPEPAAAIMTEAVVAHMATGRWDAYFKTAGRALELGRRVGGASEAVPGLVLGAAFIGHARTREGMRLFAEYEGFVWDPALWRDGPEIAGMHAFCSIWIERLDEAERLLDAMIAAARASGAVRALAHPLSVRAYLNFRRGRWQAAFIEARESTAIARDLLNGAMLANNLAHLAHVEAGLGHGADCRRHAAESLEICRTLSLGAVAPHAVHALGLLDLSEGKYGDAIRHIDSLDADTAAGITEPGISQWVPTQIEAHIRADELTVARSKLEIYEHWCHVTDRTLGYATAARCHGLMASKADFADHFEQALGWHLKLDVPFERARTHLCYGERLRRAQRRAAARQHLAAALATFRELGARTWAERADREFHAAAGGRGAARIRRSAWTELTTQEARTAKLIIDGATYAEAAAQLFLSPRTVESHLRHAYAKLGVRSRTELTRLLSQVDPEDTDDPG